MYSDLAEELNEDSSSDDDSTLEDVHQFIRNNMRDYETSMSHVARDNGPGEGGEGHGEEVVEELCKDDGLFK